MTYIIVKLKSAELAVRCCPGGLMLKLTSSKMCACMWMSRLIHTLKWNWARQRWTLPMNMCPTRWIRFSESELLWNFVQLLLTFCSSKNEAEVVVTVIWWLGEWQKKYHSLAVTVEIIGISTAEVAVAVDITRPTWVQFLMRPAITLGVVAWGMTSSRTCSTALEKVSPDIVTVEELRD